MLLHKSVEHDARVRREARALSEASHQVVVVHLPRPGQRSRPSSRAPARPRPRPQRSLIELRAATLRKGSGAALPGPLRRAVAAAADAGVLPAPGRARCRRAPCTTGDAGAGLARLSAPHRVLVYDSHELATGVPYRSRFWALLVAAVSLFVPGCEAVITVSEGIARRIQLRYRLERTPTVVRNVPDLPPPVRSGRARPPPRARKQLRPARSPSRRPRRRPRVRIAGAGDGATALGPSAPARRRGPLLRAHSRARRWAGPWLACALSPAGAATEAPLLHGPSRRRGDPSEGVCENHRLALPNKVFEYVAAGIPVVASDLPELAALVREYRIGFTVGRRRSGRCRRRHPPRTGSSFGPRTPAISRLRRRAAQLAPRARAPDRGLRDPRRAPWGSALGE